MYELKTFSNGQKRWFKDGTMVKASDVPEEVKKEQTKEVEHPLPQETKVESNQNEEDLVRRVQELENLLRSQQLDKPQVTDRGIVGSVERYSVNPKHYPDPTERLSKEPRLKRFAFEENYELDFKVETVTYENIDGVRVREPRFIIELHRIVFDEETGEPTDGRYVIARMLFHEDPDSAINVARNHGIEVDETNQKHFLDEMRYLRMKDWLLEAFYPPKSENKRKKKEVVMGGKLVEYFEINSEDSQTIPFDQLKSKL